MYMCADHTWQGLPTEQDLRARFTSDTLRYHSRVVLHLLWVIGGLSTTILILTDVLRISYLYIIPGSPCCSLCVLLVEKRTLCTYAAWTLHFSRDVSGFPRSSRVLSPSPLCPRWTWVLDRCRFLNLDKSTKLMTDNAGRDGLPSQAAYVPHFPVSTLSMPATPRNTTAP